MEKRPKQLAEVRFIPDMTKTGLKVTPSGQITIGKEHSGRVIKQLFIIFDNDPHEGALDAREGGS